MLRTRLIALLSLVAFLASQAVWAYAVPISHAGHAHGGAVSNVHASHLGLGLDAGAVPGSDPVPSEASEAGCCPASTCSGASLPCESVNAWDHAPLLPLAVETTWSAGLRHPPPLRPPR